MLDIKAEILRSQLIDMQTSTASGIGATTTVSGINTGDLLVATLNVKSVSGTSPTLDVKLQDSADNSTFADIVADALMPVTAFTQVTAALSSPATIAVDPRGVRKYVRAVWTIGGTTPSFILNLDLLIRRLQTGFGTTSG